MTEREKIIGVIEKWAKRTITTRVWGAGVYDPYNAVELADALIAAGYGDVKEAEHRAEVAERKAIILSKWLADKTRKNYPYQAWLDAAQKQAEKELSDETDSVLIELMIRNAYREAEKQNRRKDNDR